MGQTLLHQQPDERVGECLEQLPATELQILLWGVAVARCDEGRDGMGRPRWFSHGLTFARHRPASEAIGSGGSEGVCVADERAR
jgi:hypothetical protein